VWIIFQRTAYEKVKCGEFRLVIMANISRLLLHVDCIDTTTEFCKTYEEMSLVNWNSNDEVAKSVHGSISTV
jgi:hypothetical protein